MIMSSYDIIVVGGGPAGLTAGLYASRAGMKSLLIERGAFGGQIINARVVENYPGFPNGVAGIELASLMQEQASKHGLQTLFAEVSQLVPGSSHRVVTSEGTIEARAIVIAVGSQYRHLNVPGERQFAGRGVSYCATCDGFFFRDQDVAVVGGGDTALSDALELSHYTRKVHLIHRRDELRAGQVLVQRATSQPNIEFVWNSVVEEVAGDQMVSALKVRDVKTDKLHTLKVSGVFVAVGVVPNSQPFAGILKTDDAGSIIVDQELATSVPGIYAAGDIRQNSPRQIASAVGDGVAATMSALRYLQTRT
ncbi:MAG: thioredoxin-disulfide reductase [Dehalococcoidia bacterium]|nr:thioredoxin-disulfide reductase [Dehalococcoidia bacterium]